MVQTHHVLIKKRPLEIIVIIVTGVLLVSFLIATIVLAVMLQKYKKGGTNKCSDGIDLDGNKVTQCCGPDEGSPSIVVDKYAGTTTMNCI